MCDLQEPKNLEESIGFLGAGVTGLCEHPSIRKPIFGSTRIVSALKC